MRLNKIAAAVLTVALYGCGGGGSETLPEAFPAPKPDVYVGVASPGELVELTLDRTAKTYSLVVLVSQYGVPSTPFAGSYLEQDGRMIDADDESVSFITANGQAYGHFKVTTGAGETMPIAMVATNQRAENVQVADLAGFYNLAFATSAPDGSGAEAESATMRIREDGSVRVCEGQSYSDNCKTLEGDDLVLQLQNVGEGRWSLKSSDVKLADIYPRRVDGVTSFLVDFSFVEVSGAPQVGSGVVASRHEWAGGSLDGVYDCFGRQPLTMTVNGATASDSQGTNYTLTYNRGGDQLDEGWRTYDAVGMVNAEAAGATALNGRMVMLPLSSREFVASGIDQQGTVFQLACVRP